MSPQSADIVYKNQDTIVAELIASAQARIPDVNVNPDTIFRIWMEVMANTATGLFLAQQLLHDDMFIQTANAAALLRYGDMWGRPRRAGTLSTGEVTFSGSGGTFIPLSTQVGAPRLSADDVLLFETTEEGTIPNPGIPEAPAASDAATVGLLTGTYEYGVTFVTAGGETEVGAASNPLVLATSKADLTDIPLGGPGTTARKIYRRVDADDWGYLATIADNTATTYGPDNSATVGGSPPETSTAERVTLPAQSLDVGDEYNVVPGTITDIATVITNLSGVTNAGSFAGGTPEEEIESFRQKLHEFVRNPKSGSLEDLESWAEEDDSVENAKAFQNVDLSGDPARGTVTVRIAGPNATIPDGTVVARVLADLLTHDLANISLLVGTFDAHAINVGVTIDVATGYVLADIASSVQLAISNYLEGLDVGETAYIAGIYKAVFGLPGVDTLVVTTPGADVTSTTVQKPKGGVITVS